MEKPLFIKKTAMTILIVSDLHYEMGKYKNVDESISFQNFMDLIRRTEMAEAKKERPEKVHVIVLGDIGNAWTEKDFKSLANTKATFHFIYGNHENQNTKRLLNEATNFDGSKMWREDGEVEEIDNFYFTFINGIAVNEDQIKKFKETAERIVKTINEKKAGGKEKKVILCTHAGPDMLSKTLLPLTPESQSFSSRSDPASRAVSESIEIINPSMVISGHVKFTGLGESILKNGDKVIVLKVETSTKIGTYALISEGKIKIGSIYKKLLIGEGSEVEVSIDALEDVRKGIRPLSLEIFNKDSNGNQNFRNDEDKKASITDTQVNSNLEEEQSKSIQPEKTEEPETKRKKEQSFWTLLRRKVRRIKI